MNILGLGDAPVVSSHSTKASRSCCWRQKSEKREFSKGECQSDSAWIRIKDFFGKPSPLHRDIRALASRKEWSGNLSVDQKKIILEVFKSSEYSKLSPYLATILDRLSPEQAQDLFNDVFHLVAEENSTGVSKFDPMQLMQNMLKLVSLKKLEATVKCILPNFSSAQESALDTAGIVTGPFMMKAEEKRKSIKQMVVHYVIHIIEKSIKLVMMFFNIEYFLKEPDSPWEAMYKIDMIKDFFTALGGMLAAVNLVVGSVFWATIITGVGATMGVLFMIAYAKWLRPCPEQIVGCENLTALAAKNKFEPVLARDADIDAIVNILRSNAKPVLIGEPGVGKTEIVKGLAQRIASGQVDDFLKGKKIFYINTTELTDPLKLDGILEELKGHEDNAIFFFDEIHAAWTEDNNQLGEKLKTLFDPGSGKLKYVIGATTTQEYQAHIAGRAAFERRIDLHRVNPTDREQTALILLDQSSREAPEIPVSDVVLRNIYTLSKKHFPKSAQPAKSKKILGKAISKLRTSKDEQMAHTLQKLKDRRTYLSCNFMRRKGRELFLNTERGEKLQKEINQLDIDIAEKERAVKAETEKWLRLNKFRDKFNSLTNELFKLSLKIKAIPKGKEEKYEDLLKQFLIMLVYLNPALEKAIDKQQEGLPNRKIGITTKLIKEIIEQEKENMKIDGTPQPPAPTPAPAPAPIVQAGVAKKKKKKKRPIGIENVKRQGIAVNHASRHGHVFLSTEAAESFDR